MLYQPSKRPILYRLMFMIWLICICQSIVIAQEITETVDSPDPTQTTTTTPRPAASGTASPTLTITSSPTFTPTLTPIPSQTPYIIKKIITQPAIINTSLAIIIIQTQPPINQPPSTAIKTTHYPSDEFGWTRYESIGLVQVVGSWQLFQGPYASAGAFHQTRISGGLLRLPFEGEGIRVGYRTLPHGGSFMLKLDNKVMGVFETQADETTQRYTREFFLPSGYHVLDIVAMVPTDASEAVAIDYVDVFHGPPIPMIPEPLAEATPESIPLNGIQLISAPPTPQPTHTSVPPIAMTLELLVGSDRNRNDEIDPTEGISGLSVRIVRSVDNRLLASGFTDDFGFLRIQVQSIGDVTAFIPLLGESRQIRRGTSQTSWVIRVDPANVPGLIP